jgi:hypothetical protein
MDETGEEDLDGLLEAFRNGTAGEKEYAVAELERTGEVELFWGLMGVGALLLLAGTVAVIGYLGLPLLLGDDMLGAQLGQMAGIFLAWWGAA